MRLIDADALIEILGTAIRNMQGVAKFIGAEDDPELKMEIKAYIDILNGVKEQPTIEPNPHWIPCSEFTGDGYPEEDGAYFVTEQNYGFYLDADIKQKVVHMSWFKDGDFVDRFYSHNNSNIVAWMPLPAPYQEGADE